MDPYLEDLEKQVEELPECKAKTLMKAEIVSTKALLRFLENIEAE